MPTKHQAQSAIDRPAIAGAARQGGGSIAPSLRLCALAILVLACGGASCNQMARQATTPAARVLPTAPTLADVVQAVNLNSSKIRSAVTTDASLSSGFGPSLSTNIALERPRRFRLRAETGLTGPEIDLGSNDQQFWFWVRRNQPPALYFCRHDQFAGSPVRQLVPVEPDWLIEALGVVWLDPSLPHTGPAAVGNGRLRISTPLTTPQGAMTKTTVVDDSQGWILEQHLYDAAGQRVASAITSQHARDPLTDATLPREIEIQWPSAALTMTIRVKQWRLNTLDETAIALWTMPDYPGWNPIDLGQFSTVGQLAAPTGSGAMPAAVGPPPPTYPNAGAMNRPSQIPLSGLPANAPTGPWPSTGRAPQVPPGGGYPINRW